MKVFYKNTDAPQKQRVSIDVQFNIKSLNWEELINDQHIIIPCGDSSIIRALGAPLTLCAWVDDIMYPDLDNGEAHFVIDHTRQNIRLAVTIHPYPPEDGEKIDMSKESYQEFDVKLSPTELKTLLWHLVEVVA